MAKLKRDERLCPFCAEKIKAAAIRCRYCQAELTPIEPELVEPEQAEASPPPPPPTAPPQLVQDLAPQRPKVPRLTAILAALAVLAAVVVGGLWWRAETGSADSSPDGSLVGDEARSQAIVAAADLTQRALSYDATMRQIRANTLKNKIVLQADVVASSIIAATEHKARLLVFINQTTTAEAAKAEQLDRNSLVVTLVRGKGEWKLSELTALG